MSQATVEAVRRAIEAYGREGLDGVLRSYDPEIERTSTGDYIERSTYRGHEGLRRYLGSMDEEFKDLRRGERPDSNRRPPGPQIGGVGYAASGSALSVGVR